MRDGDVGPKTGFGLWVLAFVTAFSGIAYAIYRYTEPLR